MLYRNEEIPNFVHYKAFGNWYSIDMPNTLNIMNWSFNDLIKVLGKHHWTYYLEW